MRTGTRKAGMISLGAAVLASLLLPGGVPLWAQGAGSNPDSPATRMEPALALPTDPAAERKLKAAQDYVTRRSWDEATRVLQALLDGPDCFVRVRDADGQETTRWTTLRTKTDRLLSDLPEPGRAIYELAEGGHARTLLARARGSADPHLLAVVARRYRHTAAGAEAARRLALYHLDRGGFALAALSFEPLLQRPDAGKLPPAVWFSAALAFQRAGDPVRAGAAWKQLAARAPGGLRVRGKDVSLADLQAVLARERSPVKDAVAEWPLFRGDVGRNALSAGGDLVPEARWRQETIQEETSATWVHEALRRQEARGEPVLPAFYPLAVDGKVIYRSHRGVSARDAATGRLLWESETLGGLDTLGEKLVYLPFVKAWVNAYLQQAPQILFGNSTVGALSTDGQRVYAVDDLAVPPYQNTYLHRGRPVSTVENTFGPGLTEAARHSRLTAIELRTGKVVWERGGSGLGGTPDPLYPSHFLGPPLPVGWDLYGLIEKDQELHLVCLDAADGGLRWELPLGLAPARLLAEPARRVQAVHLAYADGVLVCPTNTGFLVGVDPVGRGFLWAYSYREPVPEPEGDFRPGGRGGRGRAMPTAVAPPLPRPAWVAAAPLVAGGKVVFTAPDGPSVQCLSLRDGSLLWKARPAEGDLYLAGISHGKVLLVGRKMCRALDLADGKLLWEAATGSPSGLGVLGDAVYYLPLKAAAGAKQPALCTIDLKSGRVQTQGLPAKEAPGNLLFYQDVVLSQTATALTAYPQRQGDDP